MEKENWNWKTHVLAAALGFGVGRYSKNIRSRQNETTSTNTFSSLKEMLDSLTNPVGSDPKIYEDEYFFANFSPDTIVEALLLLGGIWKALAEEDGRPLQEEDLPSIDFEGIFNRSFEKGLHSAVALSGYIPEEKEINYAQRFMRFFLQSAVDKVKKAMISATPPVSSHVSKDVYDVAEKLIQRIVVKGKNEGYLSDINTNHITEGEAILEKWKRESRPEPHVKLLGFMLNSLKAF